MIQFNVIREVKELKNQLSYSKRYGFFFGAGTSCALGVPNISVLTAKIENELKSDFKSNYCKVSEDLKTTYVDKSITIEDILNQLRQIRAITGEREDKKYLGISGKAALELDSEICKKIYETINEKESEADISIMKVFFAWLNMQNKNYSTELFTPNYDLIIEKSLEEIRIPYFDGFVGSYEPFFLQDSIEKFVAPSDLTHNWIRLWKIHGSLNWFWKENKKTGTHSIIRGGKIVDIQTLENELVIYPSKEKYDSSKKQPFVAYFDRFKNVLSDGEQLFIITGYSFSDQHINEIIFNSLRLNNRLSVIVFFYQDSEVEKLYETSSPYLNLTAFGPQKAIVNGTLGEWEFDENELKENEKCDYYWDKADNKLILGDFKKLVEFLIINSGNKENIEAVANGN